MTTGEKSISGKNTSVFVAVLTGSERCFWIHPQLLGVCLRMSLWQRETGNGLVITCVNGVVPVDAARNEAVKLFLQSGAEWLLQIDNDVVPPQNVLSVLDGIGERKIVGLPCAMEQRSGQLAWAMANLKAGREGVPNDEQAYEASVQLPAGWARIDLVGTGCFLVHRQVFITLEEPWFVCEKRRTQYLNEDFNFCSKAREKGFDVWTNSLFPCSHYKTVDLTQHLVSYHGPLVKF